MKTIKKDELEEWLATYITETIHGLEADNSEEFNKWAKSFERDEAKFVADMETGVDYDYDDRTEIPENEAMEYAQSLLKIILDNWYR